MSQDAYYLTFKGEPSFDIAAEIFEEILMDAYNVDWMPELATEADEVEDSLAPYFDNCEVSEFDADDLAKALIRVEREVDFIGRAEYEAALLEMIRITAQGAFTIHRR
jgi:hypothetical protein